MSKTLGQLLEGKDLSKGVRVRRNTWSKNSADATIMYVTEFNAYGHFLAEGVDRYPAALGVPLDEKGWSLIEPPKPRRLAWINSDSGFVQFGLDLRAGGNWERAPWLDSPETGGGDGT